MSRGLSERRSRRWGRGFTLLETLITTVLFSIVIAGVYLLYTTMQSTLSRGELQTDLQQNARVAMDRMVQEIRMAGYVPPHPVLNPPPKDAILVASPVCLSFIAYEKDTADRDADGDTQEPWSAQITYDLNGTALRRRSDPWIPASQTFTGGSAQPLAEAVSQLAFTYYDEFGKVITPLPIVPSPPCPSQTPPLALDRLQMQQIHRVAITLQTRESRPDVFSQFYTLTNDVRLRNR